MEEALQELRTDQVAIERTFTAVRTALPAVNSAAFDAELVRITHASLSDPAALDDFLTGWWRIATRAAQDSEDWLRMHAEAEQIRSDQCLPGTPPAEILAR
ncbi:hypothetical protein AB0J28_37375 [Streptosporangium canum]|uniref:hypothetical protein n=1 Tax=Streptosporangium canum TaxID=324952 RepID=UPI0034124219